MMLALEPLRPTTAGYAAFLDALEGSKLPTDDLDTGGRYFALRKDDVLVAFGGLDGAGPDQMIRSVVAAARSRGRGYGTQMVASLVERAAADRIERLWLLTTSADRFFAGLGWHQADRDDAPAPVRASRQFSGLCPSSAVLMCRRLA